MFLRKIRKKAMWEELSDLRKEFLSHPNLNTEIYRNYITRRFLYETLKLADNDLPEAEFDELMNTGKRPRTPAGLKAYDLWQAWQFISQAALKHEKTGLEFIQKIASKVMKHTGGETTTSIGRYDSSLGDFRLGEDYNEVYPLADYRNIPLLLGAACRDINARIDKISGIQALRLAADFMYDFAHIKPFGAGNLETGLLAMNYIQLYHNEPILIISSTDRSAFLTALKRGRISQTPEAFEQFIAEQQIKFFKEQLEM